MQVECEGMVYVMVYEMIVFSYMYFTPSMCHITFVICGQSKLPTRRLSLVFGRELMSATVLKC